MSKLTRGKLHQSNMIVYYIIPLIYLIYSYVYIKFNKEQKLQLSYAERKLKFEMFSFMFDLKNPIIKKINVFLYQTFNTKNKEEVNVQTNILNNIISTKDKVVAFIKFMNEKIVDDDYIKEFKILEIISKNIGLIKEEFKKIKDNYKEYTKNTPDDNTLLDNLIDNFKKTIPENNKLNTYIETSRSLDRKFNNIVNYVNEINQNIILLKDLEYVEILDINKINTVYINNLEKNYNNKCNDKKEKSNLQKEIIKKNEQLIILLNSEIEIYERIFSLNSKIDGYNIKVTKYRNIITKSKDSFYKLIYNILKEIKLPNLILIDNTSNVIYNKLNTYNLEHITNNNENINITTLFGIFFISMFLYKDSEYSYLETILNNSPNLDRIKKNIDKQKDIQFEFVDIFRLYKNNLNNNNDNIEVLENIQKDIIKLKEDTMRESDYIKSNTTKNSQSKKNTNPITQLEGDIKRKRDELIRKKNEFEGLDKDKQNIDDIKSKLFDKFNIFNNKIITIIQDKLNSDDDKIINELKTKNSSYEIKLINNKFNKFLIDNNLKNEYDNLINTYIKKPKSKIKIVEIIELEKTINNKYSKASNEKDKLNTELQKLEIDLFKLQKKKDDKESLNSLLKQKLIELDKLNGTVNDKLKKLKEQDSLPKPNYASLKTEFDNTFTETLSISEKYKEIVTKIVIKTSHNPISLIYKNNNQIFQNIISRSTVKTPLNINYNTNIDPLTKKIIDIIINKKPDDKFIEELYNNHLKNQTPVVIPFFEEYKKHSDELKKTIIKLLTKINNGELNIVKNIDLLRKNYVEYVKYITSKKTIRQNIININNNYEKVKTNKKKGNLIVIPPYTHTLFLYLIDLLIIIDYLTVFYK